MATQGSTQQRIGTPLEYLAERRSVEEEINKLIEAQNQLKKDSTQIDKKLLAAIDNELNKRKRNASKRIALEQDLIKAARKLEHETEQTTKDRLKAEIEEKERKISDLKIIDKFFAMGYEKIEKQILGLNALKKLDEERLDKFVTWLGKFAQIFSVQNKYYVMLKRSLALEQGRLLLYASLLAYIEESFKIFKMIDEDLAKFRIYMGMMRKDAAMATQQIKSIATEFTNVGVTIEIAAEATKALGDEFGGIWNITRDIVETTSLLKSQLGVAENISAGFMRNLAALSKSTAQTQRHMAYVTDHLTTAAGVPLQLVMQDVAKMSGNALALVSRMPMQLLKTAVEARKLGTTINKMADASAQLLNFNESIQSEMEATVLIGENVNLQLARELAYRRNILGSTKAILAESKKVDFENLDYFQMEAFARATGRSAEELFKMVVAERQLTEARGIDELKEHVAEYDRLMGLSESNLKNESLQREISVKTMLNQARMVGLQNQFNQLIMETMSIAYPVLDAFLKILTCLVRIGPQLGFMIVGLNTISKISSWMATKWQAIDMVIKTLGKGLSPAVKALSGVFSLMKTITNWFTKFPVLMGMIKFASPFLKVVPVLGWIITAFQLISETWKQISVWRKGEISGWQAFKNVLWNVFVKPFVDVINYIRHWFEGHSPSRVMVMISKGILAGGAMIFDALTSPWRRFLAWVVDKIPFLGETVADKIRAGATGALQDIGILEKKIVPAPAVPTTITTAATPIEKPNYNQVLTPEQQKQKDRDSNTMIELLNTMKQIHADLLNGKIGLYVDSQLLSSVISKNTSFRKGYGSNYVVS